MISIVSAIDSPFLFDNNKEFQRDELENLFIFNFNNNFNNEKKEVVINESIDMLDLLSLDDPVESISYSSPFTPVFPTSFLSLLKLLLKFWFILLSPIIVSKAVKLFAKLFEPPGCVSKPEFAVELFPEFASSKSPKSSSSNGSWLLEITLLFIILLFTSLLILSLTLLLMLFCTLLSILMTI